MIKTFVTTALSIALHITLGWAWTLGAGIVGGLWAERSGWLVGGAGVALGWASAVAYSLAVAPASTRILLDALGQLFGNIPDAAVVAATLLIGAFLGVLGGVFGTALRRLIRT